MNISFALSSYLRSLLDKRPVQLLAVQASKSAMTQTAGKWEVKKTHTEDSEHTEATCSLVNVRQAFS